MKLHPESEKILNDIKEKSKNHKRIVFVSGNFNIVHPGHLRLLRFAAECGDFLIVGVYHNQVLGAMLDEVLRLEGIKSISLVNYAFIIRNEPENFIRLFRPAVVVKGKEHELKFNPEKKAVEEYGGKLLFSSGDISFSSLDLLKREFLEYNPSTIKIPSDFMVRHGFTLTDLKTILLNIKNLKVIVVGDLIIDEYITCDPLGMSQEDPTIVVTPVASEKFIGGSGIVAAHARSLGAEVHYFCVAGNDTISEYAKEQLNRINIYTHFFVDESRPTTYKQRYRVDGRTLLRVSHLRQHDVAKELAGKILNDIKKDIEGTDVLIFSDFNYGGLPQLLVNDLIQLCREKKIMMVADSQSSSQVGDVSRFKHVELLTPTEREARLAMRDFSSGLVVLAELLRKKTKTNNIIITLGKEGLLIHANHTDEGEFLTDRIPAMNTAPKDVAGAGDSFLVCCSLAMAVGADIWKSAFLGSIAAACQVGRIGNLPLTQKDIEKEIESGS